MAEKDKLNPTLLTQLQDIAHKLRIDSINATNASNSGHPTSCSSIAEIMSVLFFRVMRYDLKNPRDPSSDRFILSKGHAAPILYAAWAEAGLFPVSDLLNLRKPDSDLEGHPTPRLNFIDVGTGSLGQGLSIAAGMAYVGRYYDKASYRIYCLLGDGETAEGSVWEAMNFASYYKLDNLCAIFDINRLGQSDPTMLQHNIEAYNTRIKSFGFRTIVVDGHDVEELCKAFAEAADVPCRPTAIIAKTFKGKFFPGIEDSKEWHGKALGDKADGVIKHLKTLMKNTVDNPSTITRPQLVAKFAPVLTEDPVRLSTPPLYKSTDKVATRSAYGTALTKIVANNVRIIALDGDTKNSTYAEKVKEVYPQRYIECFIAEQNMVGVAIGTACRNRMIPFVSAFGAFFTRAFDQIRMGAISQTNVNFVGSHCGVSIGEDGPSQMALEDLALFRSIPGATVFYPSDAVSTERAVELAANTQGICFIRTTRPNTAIVYKNEEVFVVGEHKVVKSSDQDKVLIIGAGITLYEALKAAEELKQKHNIEARVLDLFTVKPLNKEFIVENARKCGGKIVTVEDHYPEGGIGEAVAREVSEMTDIKVRVLAVRKVPHSGPAEILLKMYGIDDSCIVRNVVCFLAQ